MIKKHTTYIRNIQNNTEVKKTKDTKLQKQQISNFTCVLEFKFDHQWLLGCSTIFV